MRLRDPPRISFRGISSFYSFSVIRSDLPEIYSGYIFVYPVHPITLHQVKYWTNQVQVNAECV